jgi:D-hydroxyproline dehydrogenase subunit beta
MTSLPDALSDQRTADVVVVGGGIVGLAHAFHALAAGARVAVVERDARAVGASIRNFGHVCITAQAGQALDFAWSGRTDWLGLAKQAGFWAKDAGTVVIARALDELAVLEDFATERGSDVTMLTAEDVGRRVPVAGAGGVVGGAWLPFDVRVDPRAAVPAIAEWLAARGVRFHWSTAVLGVDGNRVHTSRGSIRAECVVVAVGHDVDYLYPQIAETHGISRCSLHMLQLSNPRPVQVDPAVLTGYSLLRYPGFNVSPALDKVRDRLRGEDPDGVAADLNLMFTQRPDGDIVLGDTHEYSATVSPFRDEARDNLLLDHARRLFGTAELTVRRRWQGVYASAEAPFLIATPADHVRVVSVTSGVGMTISFGLARHVMDGLLH